MRRIFILAVAAASAALAVWAQPNPAMAQDYAPYEAVAASDDALPASSLAGTKWHAVLQLPQVAPETWDIEFRVDGVMHYTYADGRSFDNGHWRQRGAVLFWDTNSMFSAGLGVIRGGEVRGNRVNVRGQEGSFVFTRKR